MIGTISVGVSWYSIGARSLGVRWAIWRDRCVTGCSILPLDSQISSAEKRIRATNEENDRLNQQVSESRERDASLILVGSESLVAGELTDVPVLVVAAPGVDGDAMRAVFGEHQEHVVL